MFFSLFNHFFKSDMCFTKSGRVWLAVVLLALCGIAPLDAGTMFTSRKDEELAILADRIAEARNSIRHGSDFRAADSLRLLPRVSVGRSVYPDNGEEKETTVSLSFNSSQIYIINEKRLSRRRNRMKALREVESQGFLIRSLIGRKYLLMEQMWEFRQIRASMSSPAEIVAMDEKLRVLDVAIQELDIQIEKAYAVIDFTVIGVE